MSIFQRRHHVAIAKLLYEEIDGSVGDARRSTLFQVVNRFSDMFAKDNPNFNSTLFVGACRNGLEL